MGGIRLRHWHSSAAARRAPHSRTRRPSGATLTHAPAQSFAYGPGDTVKGTYLIVSGNVSIQGSTGGVASSVNVSGRGYAGGSGPGAGQPSTNGGIGGTGGASAGDGTSSPPFLGGFGYGSITAPDDHGSGGGAYVGNPGGAGGGCVRLDVGGTLSVDGSILANGTVGVSSSGAGAGGSIFINATQLAGVGSLSASGVSNPWGGSGGGRIAVFAGTSTFTGTMAAPGGTTSNGAPLKAGAGTVCYKPATATPASFVLDNAAGVVGAPTKINVNLNGLRLSVLNGVNAVCTVPQTLLSTIQLSGNGRLQITGEGNTIAGDLSLAGTSTLAGTAPVITGLYVAGAMSIATGSTVTVAGLGSAAGPGAGQPSTNGGIGGTGGAYAGTGASSPPFLGGTPYGNI
ncbi:MAG: hypothetical protein NTV94_06005, partial [Planctomycetota bacterium]|nr:hypothetical protein [Planctomycetota bacterium]